MQQAGSYHPPLRPCDPRESEQEAGRAPKYGWVPGLSLSLIADVEEEEFCNGAQDSLDRSKTGEREREKEREREREREREKFIDNQEVAEDDVAVDHVAGDDVSFQSYEEDKSEDE